MHPPCLPPSPSTALGLGLLIPTRMRYVSLAYSRSVNDTMAKLTAECPPHRRRTHIYDEYLISRHPSRHVPRPSRVLVERIHGEEVERSSQNHRCTPCRRRGGKRVALYMRGERDRGAAPCTHVRHAPANASEGAFSILLPHPHTSPIHRGTESKPHGRPPASLRTRTRRVLYSPRICIRMHAVVLVLRPSRASGLVWLKKKENAPDHDICVYA